MIYSKKFKPLGKPLHLFVYAVLLVVVSSCQESPETVEDFLNRLPQVEPQEMARFQSADSLMFGHLGYTTIPLDDGSLLLYDRDEQFLVQVDTKGKLLKQLARSGRGPGEVQDIVFLGKSKSNEILVFDQGNNKIIRFDSDLEYVDEFIPEAIEGTMVDGVYPASGTDRYLLRLSSHAYIFDKTKEPEMILAHYSLKEGIFGSRITLQDRLFARFMVDGQVRGARQVAFSPSQLINYNKADSTLFLYWTGSSKIAEVTENFDTLRTISVDLPVQTVSAVDRDSLKKRYKNRPERWNTMAKFLPDTKTTVEDMEIDPSGRFWLRLNYSGNTQQWLIMSAEGEPQTVVHLPKEAMLTHVSPHHLGVRLDDVTMALFEPVR